MAKVRVRGITATAVSKILIDKGHDIVQASPIIRERFNIPLDTSPAEVTVKDAGQDELLVIGFPGPAEKILNDLIEALEYPFIYRARLGLHSVHIGIVEKKNRDECIVSLPNQQKGILPKCTQPEGAKILVSVVKTAIKPNEKNILSRNIRVIGKYVALIYGQPELSISEHIRDREKREELLAIAAAKIFGTGLGVHLRSNSMYASREDIEKEIDALREYLNNIIDSSRKEIDQPVALYEGEHISIIGLTSEAKKKLDYYRKLVIPTIDGHHSLKTLGDTLSEIVDFSEKLLEQGISGEIINKAINEYILSKNKPPTKIRIQHIKPNGETLFLTPGILYERIVQDNGEKLIIRREFKSPGVYDGLNIEKKPGDIDYMVVEPGSWMISHNYYRGDTWLGSYININTPPEILPRLIKAHDLLIDIIVKPGEEPEIIDREELEALYKAGIIPEKLYIKALETGEKALSTIEKHIYNPIPKG